MTKIESRLGEMKRLLDARSTTLRRELASQTSLLPQNEGFPTESHTSNHSADQAAETFEDEKAVALSAHFHGELNEVEHALHKIEVGEFGSCEQCHRKIPWERLEALPEARLCVQCQGRDEELHPTP